MKRLESEKGNWVPNSEYHYVSYNDIYMHVPFLFANVC